MGRILYCIAFEHDWRLTVAAIVLCVFGAATTYAFLGRARGLSGSRQRNTALIAAFTGGLTVFTTHFTAMQGFEAGGVIRYDVGLTVSSFFMAFATIGLASLVVLARPGALNRALGGALALAGIAAMHYLGVAALQFPGVISWRPEYVVASVVVSMALAAASAAFAHGSSIPRLLAASTCGAVAVAVLHFTAMAAIVITPQAVVAGGATVTGGVMSLVIAAMVAGMCVIAGMASWMTILSRSGAVAHIREAIEAMPDGLAFFDARDRLVLWNSRYAEVNPELAPNLRAGMAFVDVVRIGLAEGLYRDAIGREEAWIEERLAMHREPAGVMEQEIAGDRWLRVSDRRTRAGGTVTVCTDITELKRDARALAETRDAAQAANQAKSQFLANMSHEIRTPLNGVIGVAQALGGTELSARQREMLDLIRSSGQTLQVLLSDILDLARVESGRLELLDEAFDLGRAVRESAQLYEATARDKDLQFFVEIAPEVDCWIQGDVVRLKQILTNLVSNAVKFTGEGFVCLTAAPGPARSGQPTLRFSIEDTGIGFDADTRNRLFGRFEQADGAITRKFGGSGLGLAISRQLAEMMGGDLDCESEPGGGSAFMLTVPFRKVEAPAMKVAPDAALPSATASRRARVLMADDHPVNRKVVQMILAQAEVDVTETENGAQALQAFRDGDFDIVLMDMQMPVMDGLTATREMRLHEAALGLARTPVVMLTANALAEHVAAAEAAGADRHLAKPFDAAELLEMIATLPGSVAASIAA